MKYDNTKAIGKVIRIDENQIQNHLGEMVRGTNKETLNTRLDAEADEMCGSSATNAHRIDKTTARVTAIGSWERRLARLS